MNETIKGDGCLIGITDNPLALHRWITAGPEVASIIDKFEHSFGLIHNQSTVHHDQSPSVENQFAKHVKAMVSIFQERSNPFTEESKDLIALEIRYQGSSRYKIC